MTLAGTDALPPLVAPRTIARGAGSSTLQVTPTRLARGAGVLEDVALVVLLAYLLPLAILLVTTPIGLLIRLAVAAVGAL